ncbi:MAG: hypothetical protein ACKPKO_64030, partial [Candidatus Fonsibacter sp.]
MGSAERSATAPERNGHSHGNSYFQDGGGHDGPGKRQVGGHDPTAKRGEASGLGGSEARTHQLREMRYAPRPELPPMKNLRTEGVKTEEGQEA